TFVDAMGGAFNVGANISAKNNVIYNEYNPYIYEVMKMIITKDKEELITDVSQVVEEFKLEKKNGDSYLNLREYFNNHNNSPLYLYTLQIYAFQNIIRFNNSQKMNTPVGNNEFSESIKERIRNFKINTQKYELLNGKYQNLNIDKLPKETLFNFDPPYSITKSAYN